VATVSARKPTPDELLERLQSEEEYQSRGRLKIFLGYASGVGKSFRMLDEGRRRFERGQDVVVGAIQPRIPKEVMAAVSSLEVIPLRLVNGTPVMDVEAILRRAPKVCLVDGLAYDNPAGGLHAKRWQDVDALLDAGISVISSVNLQHIEEKRAQVEAVTGKHVTETIPLSFLQTADEILVVDAAPGTCKSIEKDGSSSPGKLSQMQLSELREIALLLAADVVDKQLERYLARHGIQQQWGTQERILVLITPKANAKRMLETAARNRDRFHGEMIVASANRPDWSPEQRQRINEGLELAKEQRAEIVNLDGEDAVDTIVRFARQRGITQIYVGHRGRESWWERCFGSDLEKLIHSAEGMDVRVFPHA
jgi:two-component system, OmpR family, sensor histidine kinase KdpD